MCILSLSLPPTSRTVIAIDIDPKKIELAKNNARVYGVDDRIEFIVGNYFEVIPTLKADVVFLSPPWGGPGYNKMGTYKLEHMLEPYGGEMAFRAAKQITDHVAFYLPRNVDYQEVSQRGVFSQFRAYKYGSP